MSSTFSPSERLPAQRNVGHDDGIVAHGTGLHRGEEVMRFLNGGKATPRSESSWPMPLHRRLM